MKKIVTSMAVALAATSAFAGGLLTTTNQNAHSLRFFGQYTINEDSIFFDQVGATLRISEDMEIEFAVMEALGMCTTLSVQDSDMYANDIFGNNVMILKRQ